MRTRETPDVRFAYIIARTCPIEKLKIIKSLEMRLRSGRPGGREKPAILKEKGNIDMGYVDEGIGFVGAGNMGAALARAVRRQLPEAEIYVSNRSPEKAEKLAEELDAAHVDNQWIAQCCRMIFLGVKPDVVPAVLKEMGPDLKLRERKPLLISMAARVSLGELEELAQGCPVIRIMPNTPVSIGQGVTLYAAGEKVPGSAKAALLEALKSSGCLVGIPESQMAAAGVVAGCGPAFVDLFIEALADGGVYCGLPRDLAVRLAAEMTAGAARLALESGRHPGALKDAVCSPGGSTIRGVRQLEAAAFRGAVIEAVIASMGKS